MTTKTAYDRALEVIGHEDEFQTELTENMGEDRGDFEFYQSQQRADVASRLAIAEQQHIANLIALAQFAAEFPARFPGNYPVGKFIDGALEGLGLPARSSITHAGHES